MSFTSLKSYFKVWPANHRNRIDNDNGTIPPEITISDEISDEEKVEGREAEADDGCVPFNHLPKIF